jgi:hypothetical protein
MIGVSLRRVLFLLIIPAALACAGRASQDSARGADDRLLTEREAYEKARPVFERYCANCHTSGSGKRAALQHFRMDGYPLEGHHADQMATTIRDVLGVTGEAATMPQDRPGIVRGDELRLILDWADAFDRAHPSNGAPHHHDH